MDPITLESPRVPFVLVQDATYFVLDAESFAEYVVSSKNFQNPYNRRDLNLVEVLRLERLSREPLVELYRNREQERARMEEMENEIEVRKLILTELFDQAMYQAMLIQEKYDNRFSKVEGFGTYFTFIFMPDVLREFRDLYTYCKRHGRPQDIFAVVGAIRGQIEGAPNCPNADLMFPPIYSYFVNSVECIDEIFRNQNNAGRASR